jgi:hypothetical protein
MNNKMIVKSIYPNASLGVYEHCLYSIYTDESHRHFLGCGLSEEAAWAQVVIDISNKMLDKLES